jgi:hypothetical protein
MKIREHKVETVALISKFESSSESEDLHNLLRLFDAIDLRLLDERTWEQLGLSDEDDVPEAPTRLMFPKFT